MSNEILEGMIRHGEPSKLDTAPYGTECKVIRGNTYDVYKQYNTDEEDPHWELILENKAI